MYNGVKIQTALESSLQKCLSIFLLNCSYYSDKSTIVYMCSQSKCSLYSVPTLNTKNLNYTGQQLFYNNIH